MGYSAKVRRIKATFYKGAGKDEIAHMQKRVEKARKKNAEAEALMEEVKEKKK